MAIQISVVIPTHNPDKIRLERTLKALKQQNLPLDFWELVVVDNATPDTTYLSSFDISWHPNARVVYEGQLGLTRARVAGIESTDGDYIAFVDDDNLLAPNYLTEAIKIYQNASHLGSIGGKSIPEYEKPPAIWFDNVNLGMGCRNFGEQAQTYFPAGGKLEYPKCSPIGAGMVLRRSAILNYVSRVKSNADAVLDRTGKDLTSGGDCDINLTLLSEGWGLGYFPQLKLTHLIPASRLTRSYLARLNKAVMRSWVQVLDLHSIRPWPAIPRWSVSLRKAKAFFFSKSWKGDAEYIRWQGLCGLLEGQCQLKQK